MHFESVAMVILPCIWNFMADMFRNLTPGLRMTRGNFEEYKTFIINSFHLVPKLITLPNRPSCMQPYCRIGAKKFIPLLYTEVSNQPH